MTVRIFLDACIVIDLVEAKPAQQDRLKALITGKRVFGSELVRMESRLQALRDQREDLLITNLIDCRVNWPKLLYSPNQSLTRLLKWLCFLKC